MAEGVRVVKLKEGGITYYKLQRLRIKTTINSEVGGWGGCRGMNVCTTFDVSYVFWSHQWWCHGVSIKRSYPSIEQMSILEHSGTNCTVSDFRHTEAGGCSEDLCLQMDRHNSNTHMKQKWAEAWGTITHNMRCNTTELSRQSDKEGALLSIPNCMSVPLKGPTTDFKNAYDQNYEHNCHSWLFALCYYVNIAKSCQVLLLNA